MGMAPLVVAARRGMSGLRLPGLGGCSPFHPRPVTLLVAAVWMLWLLVALSIIKD
jgi:hypothetical protein